MSSWHEIWIKVLQTSCLGFFIGMFICVGFKGKWDGAHASAVAGEFLLLLFSVSGIIVGLIGIIWT